MRQRTIVCPLIQNEGHYLLCKMADDRGVFPGQWALSGGGVEPGERIEEALRREVSEELGEALQLTQITPWTFSDDIRVKTYADGRQEEIYMIYLILTASAPIAKSPSTTSFRRMPGETARFAPLRSERRDPQNINPERPALSDPAPRPENAV